MKKTIPEDAVLVPDGAELKFKGKIFSVYQWPQKLFDGSEHTFEMLKRTDTVTVICVVEDKVVLLEDEQPHFGVKKTFPGGRIDPEDDSVLAAAQREVLEETGYSFSNWRLLRVRQPYHKIEWFIHVLLATDPVGRQEPHLDPGEKITVDLLDFESLRKFIMHESDYRGEHRELFEDLHELKDLLALPEFKGKETER